MKKLIVATVILISVVLTSCWNTRKWEDLHPTGQNTGLACDSAGVISYSLTIEPILALNCAITGCHVAGGALDYTVFANVVHEATAPSPWNMMTRISLPLSFSTHMPRGGGFLPACDTIKIKKWIKNGCLNN